MKPGKNLKIRTILLLLVLLLLIPGSTSMSAQAKSKKKKGWVTSGSSTYYYKNGKKAKGYTKIKGNYYYFSKSGKLQKNTFKTIKGKKYYFQSNGKQYRVKNSFLKIGNAYYWFKKNYTATIKNGMQYINGHYMFLTSKGVPVTKAMKTVNSQTYYFDDNGYAVTGWLTYNNQRYYFDENYHLVKSGKVDGYKISSNGSAMKTYSTQKIKLLFNDNGIDGSVNLAELCDFENSDPSMYTYTLKDTKMGTVINGLYVARTRGTNTVTVTGLGEKKSFTIITYMWFAHRGYLDKYVENTTTAFIEAAKAGAMAIETDVRLTSDGQLVCFHDASVAKMTDGTGKIADMTYEQVEALNYDRGNGLTVSSLKIPTLKEYLLICKQYNIRCMLDIKGYNLEESAQEAYAEKIYALIHQLGMENRVYISLHSQHMMEYMHSLCQGSMMLHAGGDFTLNLSNCYKSLYVAIGTYDLEDYSPIVGRTGISRTVYRK